MPDFLKAGHLNYGVIRVIHIQYTSVRVNENETSSGSSGAAYRVARYTLFFSWMCGREAINAKE